MAAGRNGDHRPIRKSWVDFMMRFELGLEPPDPARAARSAATIAASYIVGGLIPLAPYILMQEILPALAVSVGRDAAGAVGFRRDQGTLHGREAVAGGIADGAGGRAWRRPRRFLLRG